MNNTAKRDQAIAIARRNGMTYAGIGRAHGISRERVRQILAPKAAPATHELSTRVRNALEAEGCEVTPLAVRQRFTSATIKRVANLGALSISQLNSWLQKHGEKPFK